MPAELGRLTRGEIYLLDRRRQGQNQRQAAERLHVSVHKYGMWERDAFGPHPGPGVMPHVQAIGQVLPHERCLLYRRRARFTQARVARELDVCRWWVNQMERGAVPCDTLLWYWEQ